MLGFLRQRRRRKLRAQPFPEAWRPILERNVPIYGRLPASARDELHGHMQVLLAEKHFEGCGGLRLSDEMRVTIAAHAALLMLGRGEDADYFPRLYSVLVYPTSYVALHSDDESGIVTERDEWRHGESWDTGALVLAWDEARAGARELGDGVNVILHEFAHQLDQENTGLDGTPWLESREQMRTWREVFTAEYERLVDAGDNDTLLDPYGATNPAEFFAVATETFFELPDAMRDEHPALYDALAAYYRVDLAAGPRDNAVHNDDG